MHAVKKKKKTQILYIQSAARKHKAPDTTCTFTCMLTKLNQLQLWHRRRPALYPQSQHVCQITHDKIRVLSIQIHQFTTCTHTRVSQLGQADCNTCLTTSHAIHKRMQFLLYVNTLILLMLHIDDSVLQTSSKLIKRAKTLTIQTR